ncbi:YicC/YloC family endoribonuclease [Dinoroseobacter sp. S375]|uniref:YicC/YloC family endoribonuclease n=1 Tax=Dinoroseobacter sp. S375 TaxID=3415136 RepID=UPI003C79FF96
MTRSMTGFAAREGGLDDWVWTWDLKSVNGRGLDLKIRVPDWVPGLDQILRKTIATEVTRGSVTVALRLSRRQEAHQPINEAALAAVLSTIGAVTRRAAEENVSLPAPNALEILNFRGVSEAAQPDGDEMAALREALIADFDLAFPEFIAARQREGASTAAALRATLDALDAMTHEARALLPARADRQAAQLQKSLQSVLDLAGQDAPDPQRIAQELAVLAVKADVSEELERLDSHISAARDILNGTGPMGRKLDFLMQEFNREANTLCAKANDTDLTRIGLDMKVRIDQMREQVQNIE